MEPKETILQKLIKRKQQGPPSMEKNFSVQTILIEKANKKSLLSGFKQKIPYVLTQKNIMKLDKTLLSGGAEGESIKVVKKVKTATFSEFQHNSVNHQQKLKRFQLAEKALKRKVDKEKE
jgi:hypothetical protein